MSKPSDPWQFIARLTPTLARATSSEAMMSALLAALRTMPEVSDCWIEKSDATGNVTPLVWLGEAPPTPLGGLPAAVAGQQAIRGTENAYIDDRWTDFTGPSPVTLTLPGEPPSILVIQSDDPGSFAIAWPPEALSHLAAVVGTVREALALKAALARAKILYRALFDGANLLLSARTETNLLCKLCRLLVESGLFVSATIGQVDEAGIWRHRCAAARQNAGTLRRAAHRHKADDEDQPLNLSAWHAGRTLIANRYANDPRFKAMQAVARKIGIEAVASLIIRRRGKRFAVLSVTAGEPDFFDAEIVGLLERLAAMVSRTLDEFDLKSALKAEREAQRKIARHDALTGLPNALAFKERLAAELAAVARGKGACAVGKLDLDDFRQINQHWGREAGDAVLRAMAERLRKALPEPAFVARKSGDEFALIVRDPRWTGDIPGLSAYLHDVLIAPLQLANGQAVRIAHRAGFTLAPADSGDADQLDRHAEMALFAAKAAKGRSESFWCHYEDIATGADAPRYGRRLLAQDGLRLHYQPILELPTGRIVSVEALARLQDGGHLVPPAVFLRDMLLDDRVNLFRQVLKTALGQLRDWDQAGINLNVSVNVDAQILLLDDTAPYLSDMLSRFGISPERLTLEILETYEILDLPKARRQVDALRALGIRLALDDLGAGYSSLLKIRELPLDIVKLDRAFVAGLRQRPDDLIFVSLFQSLTAARGTRLIVEGVETPDVLDALWMMGVRYAQGFLIAPPMPGVELPTWIQSHVASPRPNEPLSLLGAYALHLNWERAFQFTRRSEALLDVLRRVEHFTLDGFLKKNGLSNTPVGDSYETFRMIQKTRTCDRDMIAAAASHFRVKLVAALKAQG